MSRARVVVVGGGPAGLAAAIQLTRQGEDVTLFERQRLGGLLHNANLVENYPGFPKGVCGPKLVKLMVRQAEHVGVDIQLAEVNGVQWDGSLFQLDTTLGSQQARYLVLAVGTRPRLLDDPAVPPELAGHVHAEVVPLLKVRDRKVAVIGAGDAAFDYALNLARHNQVMILNRGAHTRCLPLLKQRAATEERITYYAGTAVRQILSAPEGGIQLVCHTPAGPITHQVDDLIAAIGRQPCDELLRAGLEKQKERLTQIGFLHIIGDVHNGLYRQTSIAVGEGVRAAMKINEQIMKENAL